MSIRIIQGDCREMLATLPDASVQCCVTSPPYFGLRDYGVDGQIGLEVSPEAFVAEMVAVFREMRRVLREDATLWLNLGDSYASGGGTGIQGSRGQRFDRRHTQETLMDKRHWPEDSIKPKDLLGIPWMVAFALRADGWYLRSDVIWSKPNPMPESVTDRPTSAHEHVFLLTKNARYFYDAEAVREPMAAASILRLAQDVENQNGSLRANGGAKTNGPMKAVSKGNARTFRGGIYTGGQCFDNGLQIERNSHGNEPNESGTRNLRNVWTIPTHSFSEAHFATFPPELAERCIRAGTSERGACVACGAPWRRVTTKGEPDMAHRAASGADALGAYSGQSTKDHDSHGVQNASDVKRRILEGMRLKEYDWQPTCQCNAAIVPCTVIDPFSGAFTTAMVADRLQRDAIGIELNPAYCEMARKRIHRDAGLFADISHE